MTLATPSTGDISNKLDYFKINPFKYTAKNFYIFFQLLVILLFKEEIKKMPHNQILGADLKPLDI